MVHVVVVEYGPDLRCHQFRIQGLDSSDAMGILHRDAGDCRSPVHSEHGQGFYVGLNPGTAGGIGAAYGENRACHIF
ncbi:hypothetical protein GF1_14680 [Desulfolithobacter dissulfuricans]|uniref:Uncharacterized protein n=1 Tax=Desulfolithobacter dissulfuricans TaxID=2795293 RepID=A0A915U235_9BACT|nr:hypothetical protein GF1_14680 [Desulfolithobacter dissulfuricans]